MSHSKGICNDDQLPLWALYLVMMIDSFGYALVLPTLAFLVDQYDAGAEAGGLLVAVHQLGAIVAAPALGWISDRLGRRRVILLTLVGSIFAYVLFAISETLMALVVARAIAGCMAGNVGVLQAAAADQTMPEQRHSALGRLTLAWALGFIFGPAIGSVLSPQLDIAVTIGTIAGGATLAALLALLAFGKINPPITTAAAPTSSATDSPEPAVWSRMELLCLIAIVALSQTGVISMTGFWGEDAHGWASQQVSLLFLWVALWIVLSQALLLTRLVRRYGEPISLLLCCSAAFIAVITILWQPESIVALAIATPLLFVPIVMIQTIALALLSRNASDQKQGITLGIANGTASVGRVLGPLLCGTLFSRVSPTAPFWLVGVLFGASLLWLAGRRIGARTAEHRNAQTEY